MVCNRAFSFLCQSDLRKCSGAKSIENVSAAQMCSHISFDHPGCNVHLGIFHISLYLKSCFTPLFYFHLRDKSNMKLNEQSKEKNMYLHAPFEYFFNPNLEFLIFWQLKRSLPRWTDVNWIVHNKVALCWYLAGGGSHQLGRAAHKKCHHLANF